MDENAIEGDKLKASWIEISGKAGYAARGLIYLSIGALAVLVPFELGEGQLTDKKGVIHLIQILPLGHYILILLMMGLVGYCIWRFIQAIFDADEHGNKTKGLTIRTGFLISSISHGLLAIYLFKIVVANLRAPEAAGKVATVATIFEYPLGKYIVFLMGIMFFMYGAVQFVKCFKENYWNRMSFKRFKILFHFIFKFGLITRGITFFIIGGFFTMAAFYVDADEAGGTEKVLILVQDQSWGSYLLVLFGAGLFSFGLYSSLQAFYRDINESSS